MRTGGGGEIRGIAVYEVGEGGTNVFTERLETDGEITENVRF